MATAIATKRTRRLSPQAAKEKRLMVLGDAIRDARLDAKLTQTELGDLIGDCPQTTISRWEKGLVDMSLEQLRGVEIALNLEPLYFAQMAGYGSPAPDVLHALKNDPALPPAMRELVVKFYKNVKESVG